MQTLGKIFSQTCQSKYSYLGFIKYRRSFVRIIGGMVQNFTLVKFAGRPACTVFFSVRALCQDQQMRIDFEDYRLDDFYIASELDKFGGWYVDVSSEESIANCVGRLTDAMDSIIIPLFEKCIDCKSSLRELLKVEYSLNCVRQEQRRRWHMKDRAESWFKNSLYNYATYYMALKSHNNSFARMFLENNIASYDHKFKHLETYEDRELAERKRRAFTKELQQLEIHYTHIISKDMSFFDNLLEENEKRNIEFLSKEYPRLLTRGHKTGDGLREP